MSQRARGSRLSCSSAARPQAQFRSTVEPFWCRISVPLEPTGLLNSATERECPAEARVNPAFGSQFHSLGRVTPGLR